MEKQLAYRIPDVARLLGTTEAAVRRIIQNGDIPSRRLGRRVVVLPEELEAHLQSLKHRSAQEKPSNDRRVR